MEALDEVDFIRMLESHQARAFSRVMRSLPHGPRCAVCRAPFQGFGGKLMGAAGFAPSRKNPNLCSRCFEMAPMGGQEMEVGILFADIRGFTSMSEGRKPDQVAGLLNRFYAEAVEVLCRHAIVDKLVGDEVMALYLPDCSTGSRPATWSGMPGTSSPPLATATKNHGSRSVSGSTSALLSWATSGREM